MYKLYNGDCLEIMDEMINFNMKFDFSFTSPPYNRKRNDKYTNYNDINNNYFEFLKQSIDKNLKLSKYVFFNIQKNYYNKKDIFDLIGYYSDKIIDIIIWTKSNPMPASGFNITNAYEFILILSNTETSIKAKQTYTKNHIETSVYSENPYKNVHRAVMKPDIVNWFLERFTDEGDSILDCFSGLATTGVQCLKQNRDFYGIELTKEYYEISKERLKEVK